jgi:hypothetical protein
MNPSKPSESLTSNLVTVGANLLYDKTMTSSLCTTFRTASTPPPIVCNCRLLKLDSTDSISGTWRRKKRSLMVRQTPRTTYNFGTMCHTPENHSNAPYFTKATSRKIMTPTKLFYFLMKYVHQHVLQKNKTFLKCRFSFLQLIYIASFFQQRKAVYSFSVFSFTP